MTSVLNGVLKGDIFLGDLTIRVGPSADDSGRLLGQRRGGNRYLIGLRFVMGVLQDALVCLVCERPYRDVQNPPFGLLAAGPVGGL